MEDDEPSNRSADKHGTQGTPAPRSDAAGSARSCTPNPAQPMIRVVKPPLLLAHHAPSTLPFDTSLGATGPRVSGTDRLEFFKDYKTGSWRAANKGVSLHHETVGHISGEQPFPVSRPGPFIQRVGAPKVTTLSHGEGNSNARDHPLPNIAGTKPLKRVHESGYDTPPGSVRSSRGRVGLGARISRRALDER